MKLGIAGFGTGGYKELVAFLFTRSGNPGEESRKEESVCDEHGGKVGEEKPNRSSAIRFETPGSLSGNISILFDDAFYPGPCPGTYLVESAI